MSNIIIGKIVNIFYNDRKVCQLRVSDIKGDLICGHSLVSGVYTEYSLSERGITYTLER